MADPTRYTPGFNYSGWEADHPTEPKPGAELDNDFALIRHSIDETIRALKDVRRSDGKLNNALVDFDALTSAVKAAIVKGGYDDAGVRSNIATYNSVPEIENRNVPAVIDHIETLGFYFPGDGGGALYRRKLAPEADLPGDKESADGARWGLVTKGSPLNVRWFGALGDDSADDRAAFQAAIDYAIARGNRENTIYVPEGVYRIGEELKCFRPAGGRIDITFAGDGLDGTVIKAAFYGAGKALFNGRDPDYTTRCAPTTWRGMRFENVSTAGGVNPLFIDVPGWGNSYLDDVRFGSSNNSHMSAGSLQNIRGNNVQSYYGGKSYRYKDTEGITFAITGAGDTRTLTASAPIFTDGTGGTTSDTGKRIVTIPTSGLRRKWLITSVINATEAEITCTEPGNMADGRALFEPARGQINSGSNLLFVPPSVPCFAEEDTGRVVYIQRARSGIDGSPAILRGRMQYNSPNSVRIFDEAGNPLNATRGATNTLFATPVFDWYYETAAPGTLGALSTDNKFDNLHFSNYAGVALGVVGIQQFDIKGAKVEGEINATSDRIPSGHMWGDDLTGRITADWSTHGGLWRENIYICNQRRTVVIANSDFRNMLGDEYQVRLDELLTTDGFVIIDNPTIRQAVAGFDAPFADENNPPRLIVAGVMSTPNRSARFMLGSGAYVHRGETLAFRGDMPPADIPAYGIGFSSNTKQLVYRDGDGVLHTITATPVT